MCDPPRIRAFYVKDDQYVIEFTSFFRDQVSQKDEQKCCNLAETEPGWKGSRGLPLTRGCWTQPLN